MSETDDLARLEPVALAALQRRMKAAFRNAGLATPELDARLLLSHALGTSVGWVVSNPRAPISPVKQAAVRDLIRRRLSGESVGRITGKRDFWSLELTLSPATLEPRPETETLVEEALGWLTAEGLTAAPLRIADLGIGSGAILLALLTELRHAAGVGVDISHDAALAAARNAVRAGVAERALVVVGNFTELLAGPFDLVVSNPPYVQTGIIPTLSPEVRNFDPKLALDGGDDGLNCYRAIVADVPRVLGPHGRVYFETAPELVAPLLALGRERGLTGLPVVRDLAGRDRVVGFSLPK